jgi:hypothetical protein
MSAIDSVLRSGHSDVTVVVSDNSTDPDERGRLEEFCSRHAPATVAYVRPPEPLAMAEHWEWLSHAVDETVTATHLAYLTDRLVFTAGALSNLLDVVSHNPERVVSYQWDHVADMTVPVELVQSPWTGRVYELDSAKLIELSSRGEFGDYLPRLMNSVAPTAVVREIEQRFGNVFGSIAPDYRFAFRCLAVCDTILYLDRACLIEQGIARSAGINYMRGSMNEDAARFASELTVSRFGATPEPAFETIANAIYQEYCAVRAETEPGRFPPPEWRSYLTANAISVSRIEEPEWRRRMQDLLRLRGWTRRHGARHALGTAVAMAVYLLRHPGALARTVKRQLWDRPPGAAGAVLLQRLGLKPAVRDELRFDSAAEAITYAGAHPRPQTPYAWHLDAVRRGRAIVSRQERG